jgi:hypothetical protein
LALKIDSLKVGAITLTVATLHITILSIAILNNDIFTCATFRITALNGGCQCGKYGCPQSSSSQCLWRDRLATQLCLLFWI